MSGTVSLDSLAQKSRFKNLPPSGKFLLALALLLGSLFSKNLAVPLIVFVIGFVLVFFSTGFRFPRIILGAYLGTLSILLISALAISLTTPGETAVEFGIISLTKEGLFLSATLFLRALAGFSILTFFATSTPIPHFAFVFREAGLPAFVSEISILVYRYSLMILEELGRMTLAAECRLGYRGFFRSIKTSAKISAALLSRSLAFAERAENALVSRNFRGDFPLFREPKRTGFAWVALSISSFILLHFLGGNF